jgi:hypothetical protein
MAIIAANKKKVIRISKPATLARSSSIVESAKKAEHDG